MYGIVAKVCLIIQWFVILILGHGTGTCPTSSAAPGYSVHVMPYITFMTDRRPDVMPVKVRIYEEFPVEEKT